MKKTINTILTLTFSFSFLFSQDWTIINSGTTNTLNKVAFANETNIVIAGLNGTCLRSTDAGLTWQTTNAPTNVSYYDVKFSSETTGFLGGAFGRIYKTTDAGATWTQKNTGTFGDVLGIAVVPDGQTIFAVVYDFSAEIVKSTDNGETWQIIQSPTASKLNGINFISPLVGYVVGDQNSVYKTTNGGTSWTLQTTTYMDVSAFFSISVLDENTAFACGGNQRIMKSTNGTSWTAVNSTVANFYRSAKFTSATTGYVVGGNGKIVYTANAGTNYESQATGSSNTLFGIDVSPCGAAIAVGEEGTILVKAASKALANNDSYSITQDNVLNINQGNGLLSNDEIPGNYDLTIITSASNGTLLLNDDGSFTYTPNTGYSGTDEFTYEISSTCSESSTATVTINVLSTIGITENSLSSKVYPNPVKDVLSIESSKNISKIAVQSLDGKEVSAYRVDSKINVSNLNAGIYFLVITSENGEVSKMKFIKE
jgi:photosystem II stability/assembly factor-like uncharacterized protein